MNNDTVFSGARVPSRNAQACDECGQPFALTSHLVLAYEHSGEVVRLNYLRSMSDDELIAMVQGQGSETELPFLNQAWANRHATIKQYCFGCYGERFKKHRAYYLQLDHKEMNGRRVTVLRTNGKWHKTQGTLLGPADQEAVTEDHGAAQTHVCKEAAAPPSIPYIGKGLQPY